MLLYEWCNFDGHNGSWSRDLLTTFMLNNLPYFIMMNSTIVQDDGPVGTRSRGKFGSLHQSKSKVKLCSWRSARNHSFVTDLSKMSNAMIPSTLKIGSIENLCP